MGPENPIVLRVQPGALMEIVLAGLAGTAAIALLLLSPTSFRVIGLLAGSGVFVALLILTPILEIALIAGLLVLLAFLIIASQWVL